MTSNTNPPDFSNHSSLSSLNFMGRLQKKEKADAKDKRDLKTLIQKLEQHSIQGKKEEKGEIKARRRYYSIEIKEESIRLCSIYGKTKVSEEAKIPIENLKRWCKSGATNNRCKSGKPLKHPEFDKQIKDQVLNYRKECKAVSTRRFFLNAKGLAKRMNIVDLKLSWGWYRRFLARHNMSLRAPTTTVLKPIDEIQMLIKEFRQKMINILNDDKYDKNFFINMDETRVGCDAPKKEQSK